ncbi:TPA: class III lanthipeptide [Streptococcus suis]|nr:class III lanthipeptide [Streptococcus suis]HEM3504065.1 class III lanthipeptide [Streptococcus suis]
MKNVLSLQKLQVKENVQLRAKSSASINCKRKSTLSLFFC